MIQILGALLIIFLCFAVYHCIIVPMRTMKFYEKQALKLGYKAKIKPFNLLYNGLDGEPRKRNNTGDPYKLYKTQYPNYDLVITNVLNIPLIEICHVDFIKAYFSFDKHYDYPKINYFLKPFIRFYGNLSIGMSEGEVWKQRRAIINKLFNFQFVKLQIPNLVRITDNCIREMQQQNKIEQTPEGLQLEPHIYSELSLHIFSQALFYLSLGLKQRHEIEGIQVSEYMAETVKIISHNQNGSVTAFFGDWFYDMEFRGVDKVINRRIKLLREWGFKVIAEKLRQAKQEYEKDPSSFVGDNIVKAILLYKVENNLSDDNTYVSVEYLFSQICGLFVAGTDTTSNFWNVMVAYLCKYPEIMKKAREEIDLYMKDDDYSYQNLKKMEYLDAIEKEVTRIYGPGNIVYPRIANKDNYLNGLAVKKGTMLFINPIGNEYSEKYWKQPAQFRPQRWLNGECDNLQPYAMLGFHAGARTCIGKQFALLESKIALIKFLKRYKKVTIPGDDFKWKYNLTLCAEYFKTKLVINDENERAK